MIKDTDTVAITVDRGEGEGLRRATLTFTGLQINEMRSEALAFALRRAIEDLGNLQDRADEAAAAEGAGTK